MPRKPNIQSLNETNLNISGQLSKQHLLYITLLRSNFPEELIHSILTFISVNQSVPSVDLDEEFEVEDTEPLTLTVEPLTNEIMETIENESEEVEEAYYFDHLVAKIPPLQTNKYISRPEYTVDDSFMDINNLTQVRKRKNHFKLPLITYRELITNEHCHPLGCIGLFNEVLQALFPKHKHSFFGVSHIPDPRVNNRLLPWNIKKMFSFDMLKDEAVKQFKDEYDETHKNDPIHLIHFSDLLFDKSFYIHKVINHNTDSIVEQRYRSALSVSDEELKIIKQQLNELFGPGVTTDIGKCAEYFQKIRDFVSKKKIMTDIRKWGIDPRFPQIFSLSDFIDISGMHLTVPKRTRIKCDMSLLQLMVVCRILNNNLELCFDSFLGYFPYFRARHMQLFSCQETIHLSLKNLFKMKYIYWDPVLHLYVPTGCVRYLSMEAIDEIRTAQVCSISGFLLFRNFGLSEEEHLKIWFQIMHSCLPEKKRVRWSPMMCFKDHIASDLDPRISSKRKVAVIPKLKETKTKVEEEKSVHKEEPSTEESLMSKLRADETFDNSVTESDVERMVAIPEEGKMEMK
ncbi:hypothetical protein PCE1_004021 [Barthelona sp. PCE]